MTSQAFPDIKSAEEVEQQFKDKSGGTLESLGGEFFWGRVEDAELKHFAFNLRHMRQL